ncbi:MAG: helix-turn-helix domain-containing protein [Boseongicola sp. SB0662_bin_57]|nr:helix-turn-helix domain-containing protein [Boseongicola sp. SB0662_bin_57]
MDHIARYSTVDIAPRDRFAFWREAVCESYVQLGCEAPKTAQFSGELSIARHSVLSISDVSGAEHSVVRRKRDIRSATEEYFLVSLQRENTSRITQFGKQSVLRPGDIGVYDSAYPYLLELGERFSKTVLQFPKDHLLDRLPVARMMGGTRIDGQSGIGKLVRENTLSLTEHLNGSDPTVAALLQDTLIDLIATGLAAGRGDVVDLSSPEQHVVMRVRSFIASHYSDPGLDRNRVAEEAGMSVRRLNGIFAKHDSSITEEIRRRRLETVAAQLRDPRYGSQSISEIALNCGFNNLQHFSTVFRTAYGTTPRAYRSGERTARQVVITGSRANV